jgi:hypothetical protein
MGGPISPLSDGRKITLATKTSKEKGAAQMA